MANNVYRFFFLGLASFIFSKELQAQCPITVDAGPNKYVCSPGQTVQLDGSVTGSYLGVRWSPITGLNNPNILDPTATVNGPVTYTLTGGAFDPSAPNLVNNPGFESGNTGFTTSLSYNPTPILPGTYVITTSPALVLSTFPPCDDHTYGNGLGNMMLVNGSGSPTPMVWCQTIPVMANSWYFLGAWVMNSPISPPTMQFSVNNVLVGSPFDPPSSGCDWQEFTATWFSGAATSATVCIRDLNSSGNGFFGDDYALDDIFMSKACTVSDQVAVAVATVNVVLPATIILPCSAMQNGIQLNGSASSSGPGYSYSWDGPSILSGQNTPIATVNEPGVYTLTVSFDTGDGSCTKSASITVLPDPTMTTANAAGGEELTCVQKTTTLDGSGSTVGPNISYNWQPASGVVSGQGTLMPTVNQPGMYTLTVTHNISGCTSTATVFVSQNITPAVAATSTPGPITCVPGTIKLSGAGSSTGFDFTYLWTGPGIVSGATTLNNCVVNAPGLYTLVVTNETNGCTAKATVPVTQTIVLPAAVANAEAPGALDCITQSLLLNSTGSSSGPTFSYLWSSSNGHFNGPTNGPTVTVDSLGLYFLTVTNTQSGCTKTDTVSVGGNFAPPAIVFTKPIPALNCVADSVQIRADSSSTGPSFSYVWTTSNGNILSGDSTLTPWVDTAGIYIVSGLNANNGCTAVDTVTIVLDTIPPTIIIEMPATLNCLVDTIVIDASGSSSGPRLVRTWVFTPLAGGSGPGFVSGDTTLLPVVNAPGSYALTLTDTINHCVRIDSVEVLQDIAPPLADAGPADTLNCVVQTVVLDGSGSSQGPEFVYLWSFTGTGPGIISGGSTLMPLVGSPGAYTLLVTNTASGCTNSATVAVNQQDVVTVEVLSQNDASCFGASDGALDVAGGGGDGMYTYEWNTGPNTSNLDNLPAGTYTVTVTDGVNCSTSISLTVSQPSELLPNAVATGVTLPGGSDGTATATPQGGNAPYSFAWSTGQNQQTISGLSAGFYTVTVTEATGCTAVQTVEVWEGNCNLSISMSATSPSCFGLSNGTATATATGGPPPFSYAWSSGASSQTAANLSAGNYTVTITDANACEIIDSVSLNEPLLLTIAQENVVNTPCPNSADGSASVLVSGGAGMPSILWSNGQQGPLATGLSPGTYTASVTDANGCTATIEVQIQADDQEPPVIQAAAAPLPVGPSGVITLTTQNLGIVVVDNCSVSGIEIKPESFDCLKLGIQQVTVTAIDASGNSSTLTYDLTVVDQEAPKLVCPANIQRCAGNNIVEYSAPVATDNCLMLGGQFDLVEGLPSGEQFPEGTTTTTYTFTDQSGNVGSCSFEVTILSPLQITLDSILHDVGAQNIGGVQVTVTGSLPGYSYSWLQNGQTIATTEDLAGVGAGTYNLLVTDAQGCTQLAGPFEVSNLVSTIGIEFGRLIAVYPNPTRGKVFVVLPDALTDAAVHFILFDALGRKVQEQQEKGQKQVVLDWTNFADGIYSLLIRTNPGQTVHRIVLDRQ